MGVQLKIGSNSDYEIKCEALCYLDPNFQIVVLDKSGTEIRYRGENPRLDDEDRPYVYIYLWFS